MGDYKWLTKQLPEVGYRNEIINGCEASCNKSSDYKWLRSLQLPEERSLLQIF